jgi:hypothetical protein
VRVGVRVEVSELSFGSTRAVATEKDLDLGAELGCGCSAESE